MGVNEPPEPTVMPVDREEWFAQLGLSNFVNTYYQFRDLQGFGDCKKVLIIGPGQGLDAAVLAWRKYEVTTVDIDETFRPDAVGSAHDLSMFRDKQFDSVIASHVLEHMAEPFLDRALHEIARVGRYALVYLPVHGVHVQCRFSTNYRAMDFSLIVDLFNYFKKTDGLTSRYMSNQHFWEVGIRGYRTKDLVRRMEPMFEIMSVYRNRDWIPSQNFVLRSKVGC
jgi:SAM-dependent methyltransferase